MTPAKTDSGAHWLDLDKPPFAIVPLWVITCGMMRSWLLLLTFLFSTVFARAEPIWDMARMDATPQAEWGKKDGLTQEVWYAGEAYMGKPTRVFAYVGRPEGAGPFPAVVLVHGGGGEAFKDWAAHWAKRGYVSIAMDTAGKGPKKTDNPDGGPDQDDNVKFLTNLPPGDMWTYHAVAAAIRGHSLLRSLPEVDRDRTALTGISWGGYLTCIIAGVDHRFKAAVPVYGCGFLHENSTWKPSRFDKMPPADLDAWVKNWDPSNYLANVRCPILFFNGTNDFAYPLDSYRKSYRRVPAAHRHLAVVIELKHGHYWEFPEPDLFIDSILRGTPLLPKLSDLTLADGQARATVTTDQPIKETYLAYTTDTGPWQKRKWQKAPAALADGTLTAPLPTTRPLTCYLAITEARGATVSTPHEELE